MSTKALSGINGQAAVTAGVVVLTYGTSIAVNAALANHFRLTLTGSTGTIAAPSNATDGQKITFEIIQDATGSRTVTWTAAGSAGYNFGTAGTPTLTTTASKRDLVGFVYSGSSSSWLYCGIMQGF